MKNPEGTINDILGRGVLAEFLPSKKEFKDALMSGKKLRFYMGFDPTAKSLHLGHAQGLLILEDFRKLGHEVIFLIGDFTGMIGDPSDKSSARVKQTPEQVRENFALWKDQVKSIVDFDNKNNPFQIKYNSEWLGKLNFAEVLELASNFTVQQMLERDMFEKRMKEERPIYIHEFMYPLMQGYDSVAMDVDVELCGTDQIFNALAGRTLMQKLKNKNKLVIATKLIADEKTGMLMSKSNGTGVFLNLDPNGLFGAIMSQPDGMLRPLFLGCTRINLKEIEELMSLENPRDAKLKLAHEIVRMFHGLEEAEKAKNYFIRTISNKEMPSEVAEISVQKDEIKLVEFIVQAGFAKSNGEARRKIEQSGVEVNEKKESNWQRMLTKEDDGSVVKVGKFSFAKIKFAK
ncbi:MAG: hypothetical protein ACD_15C00079G0006 [uncultured bacterium]|nr:MAG: hypothetical protein ACD_15C00079G0006 [uncultured bacterium]HCU70855.1 tyrosine--tRNA ligase [Candidatus Moranbacteria bacterium]